MEGVFLALIQQLNSAVFTLLAILCLGFWLVYKSGGWVKSYQDFESKHEKFDLKIDQIKESITRVQVTTDLLYQSHLSTVKAHSPIRLTEKGKAIAIAIQADDKIDRHWRDIKQAMTAKNVHNPYDIQMATMSIAEDCYENIFSLDEQNEVKNHAFSVGVNLLEIFPIFGVIIRDRIFKERSIALEDVDQSRSVR